MKKILLSIVVFFAAIISLQAQTLYGTAVEGGTDGSGVINKFLPASNTLAVVHSFESFRVTAGQTFIKRSDGKIYGTLRGGIFSYDPSSSTFTKLHIIDATTNGFFPIGSLVQASDGKLYGMSYEYTINPGKGSIFSFDPSSSTATTLKDFDISDGNPQGSLVLAGNGKLYGMTGNGGSNNSGVIFSFDLSTSIYAKLKDLEGSHTDGLEEGDDGKLYGLTSGGGSNNFGVIFSVNTATSAYTEVVNFDAANAGRSSASLTLANNGKLYGVKADGGSSGAGFIFSFDPLTPASSYTKLKDFDFTDGYGAGSELMQAGNGKLYGMTSRGGINFINGGDYGVIYSFDPVTSTFATVMDFGFFSQGGTNPAGGLLQANDGKLYGLTLYGGPNFDFDDFGGIYSGHGMLFSFDPLLSTYAKLKDNDVAESGQVPKGDLIIANDGKLYGVTSGGGNGYGVIYSFDTLTSTYTKLKDFDYTNGARPTGIIQAGNGKLYGMTTYGGTTNHGVIFSFDPLTSTYAKLADFDGTNGANPLGKLMQALDGKLYGMTTDGGNSNYGVIFLFDPLNSTYARLMDFDGTNGANPLGSLMQALDGKLYGMTYYGGGVIFSFNPLTSAYAELKAFSTTDGAYPRGNLIQASNGKLYGMTPSGGNLGNNGIRLGVLFMIDPLTSNYTKLRDFDDSGGSQPFGSLMQASNGKLYGTTSYGGNNNLGVIFLFDPTSSQYTRLKDYDGANGAHPTSSFIELPECTTSFAYYKDADGDGYGDPSTMKVALTQPAGYVADNTDCDDKNKDLHPTIYYRDADKDNLGDANISIMICNVIPPEGYVKNKIDNDDHIKLQYALSNYPNPFERTSTIKYELPFDSKVSIKVYDLQGRVVATLVNEDKKIGIYTVVFKTNHPGQGVLYYKIIAKSKDQQFEQTNKMIQH